MVLSVVSMSARRQGPCEAASEATGVEGFDPCALLGEPVLQEVSVPHGSAVLEGLVALATATSRGFTLRVRDTLSSREGGRLHARGLMHARGDAAKLVLATARNAREALWAAEAGLLCPAVGAVVIEIHGEPRALDFTATRRLAMAAERHRTPCLLARVSASSKASAARRRWALASEPASTDPYDDRAPGTPHWQLDLVRARDRTPEAWSLRREGEGFRAIPRRQEAEIAREGMPAFSGDVVPLGLASAAPA